MKKGVRGILVVACMLLTAPAVAGTVYRCVNADGTNSFSSDRVSGAQCTSVGDFKPSTQVASAAATATTATRTTPKRVNGQVFSYVKDGVRHYTSNRPRGQVGSLRTINYSYIESCYACGRNSKVNFGTVRLNTSAYGDEIAAASKKYGVDEAVVRAIIHAESAFNPKALSRVGAQGLMQLMPATARRFGVGDAFDARQNISGGVQYLAWLLKRYDGDLTLAAAGYNAGEGAVAKYKGVPPYAETERYVERVGMLAARYRGTLASR